VIENKGGLNWRQVGTRPHPTPTTTLARQLGLAKRYSQFTPISHRVPSGDLSHSETGPIRDRVVTSPACLGIGW
jgi:hypothetical protein